MADDSYTMKEMMRLQMDRIESLHNKMDRIETQTTKTNGRVTNLEAVSKEQKKEISSLKVKVLVGTGILATLLFILENQELIKGFL